ncbi:MAG: site-2 protease family protein [Pirellulales bacterium]|nr:site-2 protease family protein [Pirellulales bacterium]
MDPRWWLIILLVAVGLGMIIFVHELGHFTVAKLCGVKCEKFYLGFDIAGWKLCRFRWGETEYGIGVLPLGGYVKMLGQEDNPARLKEEIERAKAVQSLGPSASGDSADPNKMPGDQPVDLAAAEAALYDPRSYLAQSVPKRMAIISAGVIMNLAFAFATAVVAYLIGVNEFPCEVGPLQAGYPAWQADLRMGDRMIEINGKPTYRFQDLRTRIPLSDKNTGAAMRIERPGLAEPIELTIHPSRKNLLPVIGVVNARSTTLLKSAGWLKGDRIQPCMPGSPAASAEPGFELGDKIVKVDGTAVETESQLREALSARRAKPIEVTVERAVDDGKATKRLTIEVAPSPMWRLGLVMEMGPIVAVQEGSPAAHAGLQSDDVLVAIDGKSVDDPMTLPNRLWAQVNNAVADGEPAPTVTVTVRREDKTLDVPVTLRQTDAYETPFFPNSPVSVPSLGVAYQVSSTVAAVLPDSPAATAGIAPGDVLEEATLLPPDEAAMGREGLEPGDVNEVTADFSEHAYDWPRFFDAIQHWLPGSKVKLAFKGDKTVELTPVEVSDWFNPDRGFVTQPLEFTLTAKSLGEAMKLGGAETLEQATLVLRLLRRLSGGQISAKVIGGPITIAKVAADAAGKGISAFLIFLTMISATLAVINFLPIPVLDGGHFVFLLYEGIRGKPADERVQLILSYVGLFLILTLMVWAIGLDIGLISRN